MKVLALAFLALVAVAASKSIDLEVVINLEDITAYDYLDKIGKPLADKIRKAEAEEQDPYNISGRDGSASLGQFPYQAGLIGEFVNGQAVCGGAILNNRRILTAAHCWWDGRNQAWYFTVVVGSINLWSGGQREIANNVIMHGTWDTTLLRNDLAMIRLNSAITLSGNVAVVPLPSGNQLFENFVGNSATIAGFGASRNDGPFSPTLKHVTLSVISNSECSRTYPHHIVTTNLCTVGAGGRGICLGDFGGPLVVTRSSRRILIGIASFGHFRACRFGFPDAYSRITSYMSWINDRL